MPPTLGLPEEVAVQVRALGARYGVRCIRVFGSVARGEARPDSDIDFLVDYELVARNSRIVRDPA